MTSSRIAKAVFSEPELEAAMAHVTAQCNAAAAAVAAAMDRAAPIIRAAEARYLQVMALLDRKDTMQ